MRNGVGGKTDRNKTKEKEDRTKVATERSDGFVNPKRRKKARTREQSHGSAAEAEKTSKKGEEPSKLTHEVEKKPEEKEDYKNNGFMIYYKKSVEAGRRISKWKNMIRVKLLKEKFGENE
ncbi:Hypothetical predicted protein [Octopus vulgaris]|uniref:Uncharacterized protein n=1 Tax=Octopus vulgaris TaxID=6645 RepID=A0AA36FBD1_OCTVU|nr:Hypothetical predicted protein [Octopus vulgaris]